MSQQQNNQPRDSNEAIEDVSGLGFGGLPITDQDRLTPVDRIVPSRFSATTTTSSEGVYHHDNGGAHDFYLPDSAEDYSRTQLPQQLNHGLATNTTADSEFALDDLDDVLRDVTSAAQLDQEDVRAPMGGAASVGGGGLPSKLATSSHYRHGVSPSSASIWGEGTANTTSAITTGGGEQVMELSSGGVTAVLRPGVRNSPITKTSNSNPSCPPSSKTPTPVYTPSRTVTVSSTPTTAPTTSTNPGVKPLNKASLQKPQQKQSSSLSTPATSPLPTTNKGSNHNHPSSHNWASVAQSASSSSITLSPLSSTTHSPLIASGSMTTTASAAPTVGAPSPWRKPLSSPSSSATATAMASTAPNVVGSSGHQAGAVCGIIPQRQPPPVVRGRSAALQQLGVPMIQRAKSGGPHGVPMSIGGRSSGWSLSCRPHAVVETTPSSAPSLPPLFPSPSSGHPTTPSISNTTNVQHHHHQALGGGLSAAARPFTPGGANSRSPATTPLKGDSKPHSSTSPSPPVASHVGARPFTPLSDNHNRGSGSQQQHNFLHSGSYHRQSSSPYFSEDSVGINRGAHHHQPIDAHNLLHNQENMSGDGGVFNQRPHTPHHQQLHYHHSVAGGGSPLPYHTNNNHSATSPYHPHGGGSPLPHFGGSGSLHRGSPMPPLSPPSNGGSGGGGYQHLLSRTSTTPQDVLHELKGSMMEAAKEQSGCRALQRLLDITEYLHPQSHTPAASHYRQDHVNFAIKLLKEYAVKELLSSLPDGGSKNGRHHSNITGIDEATLEDAISTADKMTDALHRTSSSVSPPHYIHQHQHQQTDPMLIVEYLRCPEKLLLDSRPILEASMSFMPRSARNTPLHFVTANSASTPTSSPQPHFHHHGNSNNNASASSPPSNHSTTHAGQILCAEFLAGTLEVREMLSELPPSVIPGLMADQYGNFLVQGFLENLTQEIRRNIIEIVAPYLGPISTSAHGTFAVQKLLESLDASEVPLVANGMEPHYPMMVVDVNGGHVVQKLLGSSTFEAAGARRQIFDALLLHIVEVSNDKNGCCIVQKALDSAMPEEVFRCTKAVEANLHLLITDPFGNYVIQYLIDLHANIMDVGMCHTLQLAGSWLALQPPSNTITERGGSTGVVQSSPSTQSLRSAALLECIRTMGTTVPPSECASDFTIISSPPARSQNHQQHRHNNHYSSPSSSNGKGHANRGGDTRGGSGDNQQHIPHIDPAAAQIEVLPLQRLLATYDDEYMSEPSQRHALLTAIGGGDAATMLLSGSHSQNEDDGDDDGANSSSGSEILDTLNDELGMRRTHHSRKTISSAPSGGGSGGIRLTSGHDDISSYTTPMSSSGGRRGGGGGSSGGLLPADGGGVGEPVTLRGLFSKKRHTADSVAVRPHVCSGAQLDTEITFRDDSFSIYSRYDLLDAVPPRRFLPAARTRLDDSVDSLRFTRQRHHVGFTHIPTSYDSTAPITPSAARCDCCINYYKNSQSTTQSGGLPMLVDHASQFILSIATYVSDHITVLCDNKFSSNVVEKLLMVSNTQLGGGLHRVAARDLGEAVTSSTLFDGDGVSSPPHRGGSSGNLYPNINNAISHQQRGMGVNESSDTFLVSGGDTDEFAVMSGGTPSKETLFGRSQSNNAPHRSGSTPNSNNMNSNSNTPSPPRASGNLLQCILQQQSRLYSAQQLIEPTSHVDWVRRAKVVGVRSDEFCAGVLFRGDGGLLLCPQGRRDQPQPQSNRQKDSHTNNTVTTTTTSTTPVVTSQFPSSSYKAISDFFGAKLDVIIPAMYVVSQRLMTTTSILLRELTGYHGGTALPPTHIDPSSGPPSLSNPPTFPVPSPGMFNKSRVLTIVTSSFGNYVVQTALRVAMPDFPNKSLLVAALSPHIHSDIILSQPFARKLAGRLLAVSKRLSGLTAHRVCLAQVLPSSAPTTSPSGGGRHTSSSAVSSAVHTPCKAFKEYRSNLLAHPVQPITSAPCPSASHLAAIIVHQSNTPGGNGSNGGAHVKLLQEDQGNSAQIINDGLLLQLQLFNLLVNNHPTTGLLDDANGGGVAHHALPPPLPLHVNTFLPWVDSVFLK